MRYSAFFDNINNYSFDSNKIEIITGTAKLKAITGTPEAYAYWTMDDNVEDEVFRDSSGNSRDLRFAFYTSANKVPGKIGNGLQGISTSLGFCRYGVGSNEFAFERTDPFSLECWVKFTGTATRTLISKQSDSNLLNFRGYAINCNNPGTFRFVLRGITSEVIAVDSNGGWDDNVFHHVVCTYSGNSNDTGMKIYIDNTDVTIPTIPGTLTESIVDTNLPFQISGRDGANNSIDSNMIIDEVVVYDRELTQAEITFRWNDGLGTQELPGADTSFPTDNPEIKPISTIKANELTSITADLVESGLNVVKAVILINSIAYYWNGIQWSTSTGYSQSNTITEINSNLSSLDITAGAFIQFKFFLHSDIGATTPELNEFSFDYNFSSDSAVLNENTVFSTLYDSNGNPIEGEKIQVTPTWLVGTNSIIVDEPIEVTTDENGFWETKIYIEDIEPSYLRWRIRNKLFKTNFLPGNIKFSDLKIQY